MNKTELKTLIILLILFASITLVLLIVSDKFKQDEKNSSSYLVIDSSRIIEYNAKNWNDINSIENIAMKEFKVYSNNNYMGDYLVSKNNNKYYFFDTKYNSYDIPSPFLAISVKSEIEPINYETAEFNNDDYEIINNYLKKIKINYTGNYSKQEKYITDINNDNKADYIYILCNQLYSDDIFYVIFVKSGNKYITIDKQVKKDNIEDYELAWILNTSNDKFNDILLKSDKNESYDYYLYRYNKKTEYNNILP